MQPLYLVGRSYKRINRYAVVFCYDYYVFIVNRRLQPSLVKTLAIFVSYHCLHLRMNW